jgi:hypothetical protein
MSLDLEERLWAENGVVIISLTDCERDPVERRRGKVGRGGKKWTYHCFLFFFSLSQEKKEQSGPIEFNDITFQKENSPIPSSLIPLYVAIYTYSVHVLYR